MTAAAVFCSDCLEAFCAAHDKALHIARPSHKRTSMADKKAAAVCMQKEAAEKLRVMLEKQVRLSLDDVAASDAAVDELQQQLDATEAKLRTKKQQRDSQQKQLVGLQAKQNLLQAASDSEVINVCAQAIADGSLQLEPHIALPEGLLSQLTNEQLKHFMRLLPDVQPVRQRSTDWLAMSFAGCSHHLLMLLCLRFSGQTAPALPR
jgi:hypothetical protein